MAVFVLNNMLENLFPKRGRSVLAVFLAIHDGCFI